MATHISILPLDIINALSASLNETASPTTLNNMRFLRLPHPRTSIPSLFLPYELSSSSTDTAGSPFKHGILEVQAVSPPNPRSWFIEDGNVVSDGKLLVMTPIDPMFLLIPIMQISHPTQKDGSLGTLRQLEDIFEDAATKLARETASPSQKDPSALVSEQDVIHLLTLDCVRDAAQAMCEVKVLTPELSVYRYNPEKVLARLRQKVENLSTPTVLDRSRTVVRTLAKDGLMEDGKEELLELGRKRAACDLLSQYLPSDITIALLTAYDFIALDNYISVLRIADAAALAASETTAGPKKGKKKATATSVGDEEGTKGKKRKGAAGQGVERLKKVNTDKMKKISSFFAPKA